MGKKGKKGKKAAKEPEDPYKDYLRLWMVCDTESSDVRLPVFLPKSFCVLGDVFKEMWRITELNVEYDEEDDEIDPNDQDQSLQMADNLARGYFDGGNPQEKSYTLTMVCDPEDAGIDQRFAEYK